MGEWGYSTGGKKAHCFVDMDDQNLKRSVCGKIVTFHVESVDEVEDKDVRVCFACLIRVLDMRGVSS
jgi:hypothetical protein